MLGFAAQVAPARADTYGAIAYSEQNAAYAWSVDMGNAEDANSTALSSCTRKGDGCKVVISFSNSCAALAVGTNNRFATGQAGTRQQAESDALNACRARGVTRCDIKLAYCVNPPNFIAKPGLWNLVNQPETHGKLQPAVTSTRCIKPQDIPADNWVFVLDSAAADATCSRTFFNATSNSIEWRFVCSGPAPRTSAGSIKFDSPEHYAGTVSTKAAKTTGNLPGDLLHTEGKWIAACTAGAN
ncbi:MAG TPA: DUF4189 domain-containing protein [Candidatus Acidoferrales bacterium]|nr:DUF4189 domain-containing protein [Candidatus Acidoferrales bacterium]